jgi:putative inorganic carbon (HCO3(-)) transporter
MTSATLLGQRPVRRPAVSVLTVAAALLAAGGAAYSGIAVGEGNKAAIVLPLAVGVGVILGVIAMTRFGAYVFLMLLLRSSIDLAKLSGPAAGNTDTNSTVARGHDPSNILAAVFLVAAALWLAAQYRARGGRLPGSPLRRSLVIFAATAALSITGSAMPGPSALEALRIISVVVMFAVLEQMMRSRTATRRILLAVFLSLTVPLLFTLGGYLIGAPPTENKGSFVRVTGTFVQSNTFGRYLMVMIIAGVALYPHLKGRARLAMAAAMALSSVFLLLTYTRTALVGTVAGLVVVGVLQSKRVLAGLAVAGLLGLMFVPQLGARFSDLAPNAPQPLTNTSVGNANSLEWRIKYWTDVLPLAGQNPVTGIGLNMTQYQTAKQKQPHNDFIRAYVETGLLGLGAYVVMLGSLVATGRRAVRAAPRPSFDRGVAVGFLGCSIGFVAVSLAANVMSNVVTLWYLIAFAAAAVGVIERGSRGDEEPPQTAFMPGPRASSHPTAND